LDRRIVKPVRISRVLDLGLRNYGEIGQFVKVEAQQREKIREAMPGQQ